MLLSHSHEFKVLCWLVFVFPTRLRTHQSLSGAPCQPHPCLHTWFEATASWFNEKTVEIVKGEYRVVVGFEFYTTIAYYWFRISKQPKIASDTKEPPKYSPYWHRLELFNNESSRSGQKDKLVFHKIAHVSTENSTCCVINRSSLVAISPPVLVQFTLYVYVGVHHIARPRISIFKWISDGQTLEGNSLGHHRPTGAFLRRQVRSGGPEMGLG